MSRTRTADDVIARTATIKLERPTETIAEVTATKVRTVLRGEAPAAAALPPAVCDWDEPTRPLEPAWKWADRTVRRWQAERGTFFALAMIGESIRVVETARHLVEDFGQQEGDDWLMMYMLHDGPELCRWAQRLEAV